ncbi:Transposase [Phytophthora palmivora]|uniref:Transposase n=1 Tax=Phytophthora palmivora TaxID=4796 RepID=A0A2P4XGD4_9STRA|nr:Transposase [Phytophthora palmivora]
MSVWRRPHEAFDARCVIPTYKSSRKSLMVWSSITAEGVGTLHFCEESVTGDYYRRMLRQEIPTTKAFMGLTGETLFVHDNAPAHTAKLTAGCLRELKLISLGHPPQSPDLNPIENVWFIMKKELQKNPATSIDDLKVKLLDIWTSIDDDVVRKCVLSMPKRLKAVLASKGGADFAHPLYIWTTICRDTPRQDSQLLVEDMNAFVIVKSHMLACNLRALTRSLKMRYELLECSSEPCKAATPCDACLRKEKCILVMI